MWSFELALPIFDIDKECYTFTDVTLFDDFGKAIGKFRLEIEGLTRDQVIDAAVAKIAAIRSGLRPEMQALGGVRFSENGIPVPVAPGKGNGHAAGMTKEMRDDG